MTVSAQIEETWVMMGWRWQLFKDAKERRASLSEEQVTAPDAYYEPEARRMGLPGLAGSSCLEARKGGWAAFQLLMDSQHCIPDRRGRRLRRMTTGDA